MESTLLFSINITKIVKRTEETIITSAMKANQIKTKQKASNLAILALFSYFFYLFVQTLKSYYKLRQKLQQVILHSSFSLGFLVFRSRIGL